MSKVNSGKTRANFVDADGVRWISVASAMVKYKLDPDKLKLLVTQGEVNHRCISDNNRSVHFVEETKILTRLSNDNGSSWLRDFFNIGLAAASGAVANQVMDDWINKEEFFPTQVSSVLSRFVSKELLERSKPWLEFGEAYYDPTLNKVTALIPLGLDLSHFLTAGRATHFSSEDFLAYARLKRSFHIFADGVRILDLSRSVVGCGSILCDGHHYLLKNGFFDGKMPHFNPESNETLNQQIFVDYFVRFIGVTPTSTLTYSA